MHYIKRLTIIGTSLLVVGFSLVAVGSNKVYADGAFSNSVSAACSGINVDQNNTTCPDTDGTKASNLVATVINIISLVIGTVAVIMIMVGGFKYVTSSGDTQAVNSAKNTILFAIVGMVVASLAQVLVHFVLHKVKVG